MGSDMGRSCTRSALEGFVGKTEAKPFFSINLFNKLIVCTTIFLPGPELEEEMNQTPSQALNCSVIQCAWEDSLSHPLNRHVPGTEPTLGLC